MENQKKKIASFKTGLKAGEALFFLQWKIWKSINRLRNKVGRC